MKKAPERQELSPLEADFSRRSLSVLRSNVFHCQQKSDDWFSRCRFPALSLDFSLPLSPALFPSSAHTHSLSLSRSVALSFSSSRFLALRVFS